MKHSRSGNIDGRFRLFLARRGFRAVIALACVAVALFAVISVATGKDGGSRVPLGEGSPSGGEHFPNSADLVSMHERVLRHEALPCTGPKDPINFEIFSAGPSVAGVPMTDFTRRCGGTTPVDEPPANFTNYIYGHCKIAEGDTGCEPPLEIQTWPACQRTLSDYSFGGKPIPYRRLPSLDGRDGAAPRIEPNHNEWSSTSGPD